MNQKRREELLTQLGEISGELGWGIVVPMSPNDEEVKGLIIGTNEFIEQILYRFTISGDEIVYPKLENHEVEEKEPVKKKNDNGDPTWH